MNLPTAKELNPLTAARSRKFVLQRNEDETGISGTGVIAEGIEFSTGWCALSWMTAAHSVGIYPNIKELERLHGHNGRAVIVWETAQPQPGRVEGTVLVPREQLHDWHRIAGVAPTVIRKEIHKLLNDTKPTASSQEPDHG